MKSVNKFLLLLNIFVLCVSASLWGMGRVYWNKLSYQGKRDYIVGVQHGMTSASWYLDYKGKKEASDLIHSAGLYDMNANEIVELIDYIYEEAGGNLDSANPALFMCGTKRWMK